MLNSNLVEQFIKKYNQDGLKYPSNFGINKKVIEYVQIKIMEFIALQEYGKKMILIGGSALRHLRNGIRMTYDLDYDSIGISSEYFEFICEDITSYLQSIGCSVMYQIKTEHSVNDVLNCSFYISTGINSKNNFKADGEINMSVKIDLKDSSWDYPTEWILVNKSIEKIPIQTAVISSLLSKKICGFLSREHRKSVAKDLIDIVFLLQETAPDYDYLYKYEEISNKEELIRRIELKYSRISDEELKSSIKSTNNNLLNDDYINVPYNAIEIIKDQLSYY